MVLRTLTLHGADTTVLRKGVSSESRSATGRETDSKEDPLKHLAVISRLFYRIKPKLVLGIVMLGEIKQNGCCLEDGEALRSGSGRPGPVH
jgi:hypothetical protein